MTRFERIGFGANPMGRVYVEGFDTSVGRVEKSEIFRHMGIATYHTGRWH